MASSGYPFGSGIVFNPEKSSITASEAAHFLPHHRSNQELVKPLSFNSSMWSKDERRSSVGLLNSSEFFRTNSTSIEPAVLIHLQDTHPDSVSFSIGISERYNRHEMILKLLASGSIEEWGFLVYLRLPKSLISEWCSNDAPPLQHLLYPTRELFLNEPVMDRPEKAYHPDLHLDYNYLGSEMNNIDSVMLNFHLSKSTNTQTMLVPYFDWRKRTRGKADASKIATENIGSKKSVERVTGKTSPKKKMKDRNMGNSYSRACESLLSIIVDTNKQGARTIPSLKKCGPQLPQILTQFSATLAGTGIAIALPQMCRVATGMAPFCASKLLNTGLGLGLVWLSWAVNNLRDTIISISKNSSRVVEKEDAMMNRLDRNLHDVYFRAAALMVLAIIRMA